MVEFKAKPLPLILLGVLFLAAVYRLWHIGGPTISSTISSTNNASYDMGDPGGKSVSVEKTNKNGEKPASTSSLLRFFGEANMDGLGVTWSHGTNKKEELRHTLSEKDILMVEADVRMNDNIPVMAHDVKDVASYDLTLREWLSNFKGVTHKGIKLDIKVSEAVEPSVILLKEFKSQLNVPIIVNADIIRGPNGPGTTVDAAILFDAVEKRFPDVTLSVGWTTGYRRSGENSGYTRAMVDEMIKLCGGKTQQITFPVRASLLKNSLDVLKQLLSDVPGSSLTIWHYPSDDVNLDVLATLRKDVSKSRIFYDLPSEMARELDKKTSGR